MKASEMVEHLNDLIEEHGDLEVIISDGYRGNFYSGNDDNDFDVGFYSHNGKNNIDIGVGGCDDDDGL